MFKHTLVYVCVCLHKCVLTCATWSWMPPSAIMRSVCSVIWRASTPSEVERFTDQYVMRNIRFTMREGREKVMRDQTVRGGEVV